MSASSLRITRIVIQVLCSAVFTCSIIFLVRIRFQSRYFFAWLPLFLSILTSSILSVSLKGKYPDSLGRRAVMLLIAIGWFSSPGYRLRLILSSNLSFEQAWWCPDISCKASAINDILGYLIGFLTLVEFTQASRYDRARPSQKPVTAIFAAPASANPNTQYIPLDPHNSYQPQPQQPLAGQPYVYNPNQPQPQPGYAYPSTAGAAYQPPAYQQPAAHTTPYQY